MRIVTWNCRRGPWAQKRAAIDDLQADIAVITEAPRVAASDDGVYWFGPQGSSNGMAVIATGKFEVQPLSVENGVPCVVPARITGPRDFTLLTVWTWPVAPHKDYKQPFLAGLKSCEYMGGPFVIAGDLNGNPRFDRPGTRVKWSSCFAETKKFDVVSAYHAHFSEEHGQETRWTQFQTGKENMPFHLDYVFVPSAWRSAIRDVRVPTFGEFTMSDHRPVIVDLEFASKLGPIATSMSQDVT